jgi:hypothetical protein
MKKEQFFAAHTINNGLESFVESFVSLHLTQNQPHVSEELISVQTERTELWREWR